jgi:hypothetical protein
MVFRLLDVDVVLDVEKVDNHRRMDRTNSLKIKNQHDDQNQLLFTHFVLAFLIYRIRGYHSNQNPQVGNL